MPPPWSALPPPGTSVPPPPPQWPQAPAPQPGPFAFPRTGSVPQASGPAPAFPGPAAATTSAPFPPIPGLTLPSSGSVPTTRVEKRGLFGISWLGGRKAPTNDDPALPSGRGGGGDDEPSAGTTGFFERPVVLIILGIFALVGLGSGVYLLFFQPAPVTLPARVENIPLATPTFSPIAPTGDSAFRAALPSADLEYGLRTAEPSVMRPITQWPTRFAEEWLLTYDGGAGKTMTVEAVQHYSLNTATKAFEDLLAATTSEAPTAQATPRPRPSASTSVAPTAASGITMGVVKVNKVEVGKSFKVIKNVTESVANPAGGAATDVTRQRAVITWQNGTGVFVMTADPAVIDGLFTAYGL